MEQWKPNLEALAEKRDPFEAMVERSRPQQVIPYVPKNPEIQPVGKYDQVAVIKAIGMIGAMAAAGYVAIEILWIGVEFLWSIRSIIGTAFACVMVALFFSGGSGEKSIDHEIPRMGGPMQQRQPGGNITVTIVNNVNINGSQTNGQNN